MRFFSKSPNLLAGIIITVLAYFFFAIAGSLVKAIGPNISSFEIVFFLNFFSLIIIIPYCLKKKTLNFRKSFWSYHLIRDITGVASYICYYAAIKYINLIDATVLAYTSPFFTPFIWWVWAREKIEKDVWWTIILGFIGIAFILKPTENIFRPGAIIGLASGVLSALSLVTVRILNQRQASLSHTLFYYFLVGTIIAFPIMTFYWKQPSIIEWIYLIAIGLTIVFGQILLTIAYRHGTASFLSPLSYSIVIFILFISWIVFNHYPGLLSFIGTALIVIGGTFSFIQRQKPKKLFKIFENPNYSFINRLKFWKKPSKK